MPSLISRSAEFQDQVFPLEGEQITVGREEDNTLSIPHPSISSHHGEFRLEDGDYRIVDHNSTNGTRVNDEKITETILRNGDVVMFGNILFTYQSEHAVDASPLPDAATKVDLASAPGGSGPSEFKNLAPFKKADSSKSPAITLPVIIGLLVALGGLGYLGFVVFSG